ncbi:MAG: 3-deoxy-7-phosphoheptulonate synthase [Candidatus Diapherotrites archaeon]|nr:3-deoxy-7-phosphoheptulonate synthase [Candidatus Diapherotrites archaeon]
MGEKKVSIGNVAFGGKEIVLIAGPCSVESEEQLLSTARVVKKEGARVLRGSAFKPRSSPDAFQGLGKSALEFLQKARSETGLPIVSELMDTSQVNALAGTVDCVQVGARAMQNFELLKALAKTNVPVLLKNGLSATVKEFLQAADYLSKGGNKNVILCLRGIRTFETETRFTLDLGLVPALKKLSGLPIVVDPSHAAGKRETVPALAKAAVAAGADGLIIEVHPEPENALSDSAQQLNFSEFQKIVPELNAVAKAVGRKI